MKQLSTANGGDFYWSGHRGTTCDGQSTFSPNKITIKYDGKKGAFSETCYARSNETMVSLFPNGLPLHGYISVHVHVNDGGGSLWPAFWMDGSGWPTGGEIDIAELQGAPGGVRTTHTNLIGDPTDKKPHVFDTKYMVQYAIYKGGLEPNSSHNYGFEWEYSNDKNTLTFSTYCDGKKIDFRTFTRSGQMIGQLQEQHATTVINVFKGFPNMNLIFDADDTSGGAPYYQMTVSNVKLFTVGGHTPPSSCPAPVVKKSYSNQSGVTLSWDNKPGDSYVLTNYNHQPLPLLQPTATSFVDYRIFPCRIFIISENPPVTK